MSVQLKLNLLEKKTGYCIIFCLNRVYWFTHNGLIYSEIIKHITNPLTDFYHLTVYIVISLNTTLGLCLVSTPCVVEVIQWRLSNRVLCPLAALTFPLLHRQALWKEYTHVTFNATSQELPLHCLKTHSDTPNLTLPPSHMHEHTPISLLSFPHPCLHRPPVSSSSLSAADSPWALIARLSFYSPASFFFIIISALHHKLLSLERRRET